MARRPSPFQHDAMRDTLWVGKGVRAPWLIVVLIVIAAGALALVVR